MGKLGRWIDGLSDEQKDRVVRTQSWFWQFHDNPGYHRGKYCIAGAAFDLDDTYLARRRHKAAAVQYDRLCRRFPGDRIVRACKQRAVKGNDKINVEVDLRELEKADAEPQLQSA